MSSNKHQFSGNRYDHVIAFTARACLYELVLSDKNFIKQNFNFFKSLTFYLINDLKIRDGKDLMILWNTTFIETFSKDFPDSQLTKQLRSIQNGVENVDPIDLTYDIGKTIDLFFKNNPKEKSIIRNMKFDQNLVPQIVNQSKKNWIQKLFKS